MVYYQIDDKIYFLNLDAVFALVSETPNTEKMINTTITQYYGGEEEGKVNNGKEIVESKSNLNDTMNNVRYDFIKYLISCVLSHGVNSDGSPFGIKSLKDLTFGQGLCFNTLIEYKILCEVKTNE